MYNEHTEGEELVLEDGIEVWVTDNSEAVAWGTHDTVAASWALLADLSTFAQCHNAMKMWSEPENRTKEDWEDGSYGSEFVEGWVPFLVADL